MAFHEIRVPTDVSYGSSGGPGWSTNIQRLDSGSEIRIARWSQAKHKYDAAYGIKTLTQLNSVLDFYHARRGPAHGFRWKDWMDFTTASDNRSAHDWDDEVLGEPDGTTRTVQMKKTYTSGAASYNAQRNLSKIVAGTMKVGWGGSEKTTGGGTWTVDEDTGIITIHDSGAYSADISAGCEFDVPVRFGDELDENLSISHDAFEIGSIGSIPIVEIEGGAVHEDVFPYGGVKTYTGNAAPYYHGLHDGRVLYCTPNASQSIVIHLPKITGYWETGGPYFYVVNKGASGSGIVLKKHADQLTPSTLGTIPPDEGCMIFNAGMPGNTTTTGWPLFPP